MVYFTLHVVPADVLVGDRVCYYNTAGGLEGVARVTRTSDKRGNLTTERGEYVSFGEDIEIAFGTAAERDARAVQLTPAETAEIERKALAAARV